MKSFEELYRIVEQAIAEIEYNSPAPTLFEPAQYMLTLGGKRVRPILTLMAADIFSDNIKGAIAPAIGLELFHNFTLLHDDLMDRSEMRRGKMTVHKKWNENVAILSGDALHVLACQYIMKAPEAVRSVILQLFTQTAIEVCAGQQYDLEFEDRLDVSEQEYLEMIRLKTAVLLACALKTGALAVNAPNAAADCLYRYGIKIGMAFQLRDDLLDVYANSSTFGKKIGGDILCNKKTFLLINALRKATGKTKDILMAQLKNMPITSDQKKEKIEKVTEIYDILGLRGLLEEKINAYYNEAAFELEQIKVDPQRVLSLKTLAGKLMEREV